MAATDKTCVPGRWTVLWRIHSLSCLEEFDFNSSAHTASSWCLILLLILKPDSETPHTEFSHLVPGLVFFIGSVTVGSTVWQFQPIVLPPRILFLIIGFFMQNWSCLLLWLQPIKHAILVAGLFCAKFIFSPGLLESDVKSIVDTVSTWCLTLLLILKPDFETPDTEFSHFFLVWISSSAVSLLVLVSGSLNQ